MIRSEDRAHEPGDGIRRIAHLIGLAGAGLFVAGGITLLVIAVLEDNISALSIGVSLAFSAIGIVAYTSARIVGAIAIRLVTKRPEIK